MSESNVFAKQTGDGVGKLSTTELGGRVRVAHCSYVGVSGDTAGSVIPLVRLPKGARVLPQSQLAIEAGQNASLTIKVGDSADDDRYLSITAGTVTKVYGFEGNLFKDVITTAETVISITTGGAALTVDKAIVADIFYVVD